MIHKSKVLLPFDIYSTAITGHRCICLSFGSTFMEEEVCCYIVNILVII